MYRTNSTRLIVSVVSVAVWAAVAVATVSAQIPDSVNVQLGPAAAGAGVNQQEAEIGQVVARVINVSLSLIGIVLVALLVYAGWLWMTAAGEEEKITKAKGIIRSAIIGIIIVFLAYGISRLVIRGLTAATSNAGRF